ncbi:MAG: hypothetical protein IKS44_05805 [Bacteroidales bacterium]|nr:hypothetical protein [Bacteroidales bacterium]
MKKCAKLFFLLLVVGGLLTLGGTFVSCKSSKSTTMYETKKYSQSKTIKQNIKIKGTNKRNGHTYRSY